MVVILCNVLCVCGEGGVDLHYVVVSAVCLCALVHLHAIYDGLLTHGLSAHQLESVHIANLST